jgi:predicted phosphoribosyltransferase
MRAAIKALRKRGAARVVVAVPLAPADTCEELRGEVDDLVCLEMPEPFVAVGMWYEDFSPTSDEEVREILDQGAARSLGRRVSPNASPAPKNIPS